MNGRMVFEGNPWPEGHGVLEVELSCGLSVEGVALLLHLKTDDYNSEREIEHYDANYNPLPGFEDLGSWQHPGVWENYHACTLSNTFWGRQIAHMLNHRQKSFAMSDISGRELIIDPVKTDATGVGDSNHEWDFDTQAFHIYLLGHDAVANHHIILTESTGGIFALDWTGLIAEAYVGGTHFKHKFKCHVEKIPFLGYQCPKMPDEDKSDALTIQPVAAREAYHRNLAKAWLRDVESLNFHPRLQPFGTDWLSVLTSRPSAWPIKDDT